MFLEDLIGKFNGATIGVLGSGPTLLDYKDDLNRFNDLVISTNGSLMSLNPKSHLIDFFIYGDQAAPKRQWFDRSTHGFIGRDGMPTKRTLPTFLLPFDPFVLKDEENRNKLKCEFDKFKEVSGPENYIQFRPNLEGLDLNGVIFYYKDLIPGDVLSGDNLLSSGGTITGVASQFAGYLGATRINLFGCGFSNFDGKTYAYDSKNEPGITTINQARNMDLILESLKSKGIKIFAYGNTNLKVPERV